MAVQLYDSKGGLAARPRVASFDYDVMRIGELGYIESLNPDGDYDDRP